MSGEQICPVCNGTIPAGENTCPRCGFRLAGLTESFAPIKAGAPEVAAVSPSKGSFEFSLYVAKGPQPGEEFFLDSHKITVGRDPHCDIFLNDMTVSREHAIITVDGETVTVQDDDSLNGTWVNGVVSESASLVPGDMVQIGTFTMVLQKHATTA